MYLSNRKLAARGLGCVCDISPVVIVLEVWDKMRRGFERVFRGIACRAKGSSGWPDSADAESKGRRCSDDVENEVIACRYPHHWKGRANGSTGNMERIEV